MRERPRRLNAAFLLPLVLVGLYYVHTRASIGIGGLIAFVAGTVVALDYRGISERIPPSLGFTAFSRDLSPKSTRRTFGWVAVAGLVTLLVALTAPDLIR
jgi:hypothetical protein